MYTELHLNIELKSSLPKEVIDVLKYMINSGEGEDNPFYQKLFKHEFFQTDRWSWMFRCDSYYFTAPTRSTFEFDKITDAYTLSVQCNLKNYDNEIQKFLHFITPYISDDNDDFLGYYRYEEHPQPTLIYLSELKAAQ